MATILKYTPPRGVDSRKDNGIVGKSDHVIFYYGGSRPSLGATFVFILDARDGAAK